MIEGNLNRPRIVISLFILNLKEDKMSQFFFFVHKKCKLHDQRYHHKLVQSRKCVTPA